MPEWAKAAKALAEYSKDVMLAKVRAGCQFTSGSSTRAHRLGSQPHVAGSAALGPTWLQAPRQAAQ